MFKKYIKLFCFITAISLASCSLDPIANPNGPTVESYATDASLAQLQLLTNGVEAILRNDMEFYYQTVSIVGREYYDLNGTDPRYTGELLGAGDGAAILDDNGFLTTRSFSARYRAIRSAENLISAVNNSNAGLDDAGKNGFYALANTAKAYQLLLVLNRQFENGVRVDISDPDNLGPFLSYGESLVEIKSILNEALSQSNSAGSSFAYTLSSGFAGFDTPSGFTTFINALLARVEIYDGNKSGAMSALAASFIDPSGDFNTGVFHTFSAAGNDRLNPLFYAPVQNKYMAHSSFVADAEAGDARLSKVSQIDAVSLDGLTSSDQVQVYSSNDEPVAIIRNEELILLRAEAMIGSNNAVAVDMINVIRNGHGLSDYSGGASDGELVTEVLAQRRYSLFGEGHRWIDMRRYNRLGDLPLDRPGDEVFTQFPRPQLEP